jgi:hypothetical protein
MGRKYVASGDLATWTAAGDIVELIAPSDAVIVLHALSLHQSTSEVDDSCSLILSRVGTSGSGGGAITSRPMEAGDAAFGGTCEEGNTTDSTGNTVLNNWGFSTLAGFDKIWTPEMRPVISPSAALVLLTGEALSSVTLEWSLEFEEIGG